MPLALTRSPGQAVLFTGAVRLRLEVREVYRYHVVLQIGEQIRELRAGRDLHVTPELMLQLSDISGRQARIAFTAPADVQIMREELQPRHTVRRGRSGDYECACGATWDYRDGAEHP